MYFRPVSEEDVPILPADELSMILQMALVEEANDVRCPAGGSRSHLCTCSLALARARRRRASILGDLILALSLPYAAPPRVATCDKHTARLPARLQNLAEARPPVSGRLN